MTMRVVICGGGVIGASTAYYLSRQSVDTTVIEVAGVANAASGKAGGFLAYDWCAGTPLDALARRSFTLHAQLPDEIGGELEIGWGHRRMSAYSGYLLRGGDARQQRRLRLPWLSDEVIISAQLGAPETTAIVDPGRFTSAMMHAAEGHGARLLTGRITGLVPEGESRMRGVDVEGGAVEADAIVIAMGPWSILAAQWLKLPRVWAQKSHSLIYDTADEVPGEALFLEHTTEQREAVTIEVFPRAGGRTYVTAFASSTPLPVNPSDVKPEPAVLDRIEEVAARVSPALQPSRIVARQACYRPIVQDGLPLIGKVPGLDNVYVATGHNVWGILNAPATGEAMAELIAEGAARSTDLTAFDPIRLPPLDAASLRIG
jgi:glycine/D-amino acid oxidase-like deaminating enzyme